MIALLEENPILLLFLVAGVGFVIGRVKVAGFSLGVAAVLFAGLGFGALGENVKLPEFVYLFGLVLFVYTVGLSSGPGFFAALRRRGLRDNAFVLGMIVLAAVTVVAATRVFGIATPFAAGLFAGSLTNTPALAGVLETLKAIAPAADLERLLSQPVVAYSVCYPIGVIGMLAAIALCERLWRVPSSQSSSADAETLTHRSVLVTREFSAPILEVARGQGWPVLFSRHRRAGNTALVTPETTLQLGDVVSLVGKPGDVERVLPRLGEASSEEIELDRRELDFRRVVVSNPGVVGRRLRELQLPQRFGALVTRVARGDTDFLPAADTVLEPGDRVRVVCPPAQVKAVSEFLGDSYRAVAEIDVMTFSLGIALGLLLGSIVIPLPGGSSFKLGFAGGPLIVALVLGALGRTGRLVWQLPHSANLTLRQLGTILFLAGVGTRSGYAFSQSLGSALLLLAVGAVVTCLTAGLTLWIGHKLLRIPFATLTGMLAGLQTQPAVLAFALERSRNDAPNIGYATVYPVAMIAKIVIAQLILTLLR
jgi:putative transport protein